MSESTTPNVDAPTSPVTRAEEGTKIQSQFLNPMIIGLIIIILLFVPFVIAGGYVFYDQVIKEDEIVKKDDSDEEKEQGSSSSSTNADVEVSPTNVPKVFQSIDYSVEYAPDLVQKKGLSSTFIYLKDPATLQNEANPNVNMPNAGINIGTTRISASECSDLGEGIVEQLAVEYTKASIIDTDNIKVNDYNVCAVYIEGIYKQLNIYQELYYFINPDEEKDSYPIVLTTTSDLEGYDVLYEIIESFEFK